MSLNRRAFLRKATATAAAFGAARLAPAVSVPTMPGHADLMSLLIDTDRDRLLERLVARIRDGLGYPALLGAIADASARQIRPYPHVGFKYHAFMVLQAVHRTTRLGRPQDRWLPVLWAADVFKGSQAAEQRLGNWALGPVPEHRLPAAHKAEGAFQDAMERWDPEAADAAVVGLARSVPRDRLFALLFRYGARDFRAIGHKAIAVANCYRLLGVVSPEHTEPMLRSLVLALLNHEGEPNPVDGDLAPDRAWRHNLPLANQMKAPVEPESEGGNRAVFGILDVMREGSDEDAGRAMLAGLEQGVPEQQLWTAVFLAAGDLMLKQSGIISVHANTSVNAMHLAYRHAGDPGTSRLILLQAAAFLPLFRGLLGSERRSLRIDTLEALDQDEDSGSALDDIFATVSVDRVDAARKTLDYLAARGAEPPFMSLARQYVVDRNTGYHDYKFAEAAFENAAGMESPWREPYLAASVLYLNGSNDKPNETIARARSLLG